jgi:glycosyltransferase involved in cell wall biosynthesis
MAYVHGSGRQSRDKPDQNVGDGMTVLMTAGTAGSVWTYALDLARSLGRRDVDVVLATMGDPPTPEQRREAGEIDSLTVVESSYRLESTDEPWSDVEDAGTWLLELDRRVRPDIVHLNGYVHGALPFASPVLVTAHACMLSWWSAVKGEDAPSSWNRYRAAVSSGLAHADVVIAPSRAMAGCVERFHAPRSPVRVIPNGRDASPFTADGPKGPFVLATGRYDDEGANLALVADAAPAMPWPVYVAGDTGEGPAHSSVTPLGRLSTSRLAQWYADAAIYARPARYEPFGMSVLEAALSGCALVLGDIPSLREVWGTAALFVRPDDPVALAGAVTRLAEDEPFRQEMSARARARARRYSVRRAADAYLALYAEISDMRAASAGGLQTRAW